MQISTHTAAVSFASPTRPSRAGRGSAPLSLLVGVPEGARTDGSSFDRIARRQAVTTTRRKALAARERMLSVPGSPTRPLD